LIDTRPTIIKSWGTNQDKQTLYSANKEMPGYLYTVVLSHLHGIVSCLVIVAMLPFADYGFAEDGVSPPARTISHQSKPDAATTAHSSLFKESLHILGSARTPVARWEAPIKLAIIGSVDELMTSRTLKIFNEISLLTGIRYRIIKHRFSEARVYAESLRFTPDYDLSICDSDDSAACANFVVVISDRAAMHDIAMSFPLRQIYQRATSNYSKDALCFFSPGISPSRVIVRAMVFVEQILDDAMIQTCLQEEIFQSFGLFGDFTNSRYFSFNNQVEPKSITKYDKRLLSSLYDQSFAPGIFAKPVVKQLVEYCSTFC